MVQTKIIFNGKEYNSISEMPQEIRVQYEKLIQIFGDSDKNGVPDILELRNPFRLFSLLKNVFSARGELTIINEPDASEQAPRFRGHGGHAGSNQRPTEFIQQATYTVHSPFKQSSRQNHATEGMSVKLLLTLIAAIVIFGTLAMRYF